MIRGLQGREVAVIVYLELTDRPHLGTLGRFKMQGVAHGVMTRMPVPAHPGGDRRAKTGGVHRGVLGRPGTGVSGALARALVPRARSRARGREQRAAQGRAQRAALEAVPRADPPAVPRVTPRVGLGV